MDEDLYLGHPLWHKENKETGRDKRKGSNRKNGHSKIGRTTLEFLNELISDSHVIAIEHKLIEQLYPALILQD
jgi:hypothetical protein